MSAQVNSRGEGPRHAPSYGSTLEDTFLGYANELDVWLDVWNDPHNPCIAVVGPAHKVLDPASTYNFDVLRVEGGLLELWNAQSYDLHIDPHDMSLIYALCVEHGLMEVA